MRLQLFLTLIVTVCSIGCGYSHHAKQTESNEKAKVDVQQMEKGRKKLTESEAILRAEEFIIQNGYTDLPPLEDKSKLSFDIMDGPDPETVLKYRYNTLEFKAYGIIDGSPVDPNGGWTVVFRYNKNNEGLRQLIPDFNEYIEEYGRAVTMDAYGDNIRMVHQDIGLKSPMKIISLQR
jgi:hypothetical protein